MLAALAVHPDAAQLVPARRLRQALADLFGVHLSQGTVAGLVARAAERFAGPALHIRDAVAQAPVKHMDETGVRGRGRLAWLHVACTGRLSHFRLGAGRGDVTADATGFAVPDRWRHCFNIPGTLPLPCAAHVPRAGSGTGRRGWPAFCGAPSAPAACRTGRPFRNAWRT